MGAETGVMQLFYFELNSRRIKLWVVEMLNISCRFFVVGI